MSRKHDREFKLEAVRMASEEGVSASGVEWRYHQPLEEAVEKPGRRELKRVTQERDILKKAAAFFANESR